MGILYSGLFGGFSKKSGPVVGRRRNGQNIVTGLHHPTNKPATEKQVSSRQKFSILNIFLGRISPLLDVGFKKYAKKKGAMGAAYAYNYGHAFMMAGDGYVLNYPGMVYSRGPVSGPLGATAEAVEGGIRFDWMPQSQSVYCRFTDTATFLGYCPSTGVAFARIGVTDRYAQTYFLELPAAWSGAEVHVYMSFNSADGKLTGNSVYIGKIDWPELV